MQDFINVITNSAMNDIVFILFKPITPMNKIHGKQNRSVSETLHFYSTRQQRGRNSVFLIESFHDVVEKIQFLLIGDIKSLLGINLYSV